MTSKTLRSSWIYPNGLKISKSYLQSDARGSAATATSRASRPQSSYLTGPFPGSNTVQPAPYPAARLDFSRSVGNSGRADDLQPVLLGGGSEGVEVGWLARRRRDL